MSTQNSKHKTIFAVVLCVVVASCKMRESYSPHQRLWEFQNQEMYRQFEQQLWQNKLQDFPLIYGAKFIEDGREFREIQNVTLQKIDHVEAQNLTPAASFQLNADSPKLPILGHIGSTYVVVPKHPSLQKQQGFQLQDNSALQSSSTESSNAQTAANDTVAPSVVQDTKTKQLFIATRSATLKWREGATPLTTPELESLGLRVVKEWKSLRLTYVQAESLSTLVAASETLRAHPAVELIKIHVVKRRAKPQ